MPRAGTNCAVLVVAGAGRVDELAVFRGEAGLGGLVGVSARNAPHVIDHIDVPDGRNADAKGSSTAAATE